jgi:predicted TIM-barrel fold metal-dependent hydrolase
MNDAKWRAGFARLAPLGLHFDLQTPWWHLADAARLACDFPDTTIILNHTGLPSDRSDEGLANWERAIKTLASCPNAMIKVSGLGLRGQPWTVDANRTIVLKAIEAFSPARAMFASNFPVDSLCASFDTIFTGFRTIVSDFSASEQLALFHDNAIRIYNME